MKFVKKTVTFPLFQKCSEYCKDEYWKQLLRDMAIGKMPKNILVIQKSLVSNVNTGRVSKKSQSLNLEGETEEELTPKIIDFIQVACSIFSAIDIKKKNVLINQIRKDNTENKKLKWQQIRKSHLRKMYLLDFVYKNKVQYDLNWFQARSLYKQCEDFLTCKGSSKKVDFQDGEIISIEGVLISPGKFEVQKVQDQQRTGKFCKKETRWENYLRDHLKHIYSELN
jgi:hypothetical protein